MGASAWSSLPSEKKKSKGVLEDLFEQQDERLKHRLDKLEAELKESMRRERRLNDFT